MFEKKKYELLKEDTILYRGISLYRIKALIDFGSVKAGDLGGYIEKESNLSHDGDAWVSDEAKVYDDASVSGNATVVNKAEIHGNASVFGNAKISGETEICGNADVYGEAKVFDNAKAYGDSRICGNAKIYNNVEVGGDAFICDEATIGSFKDFLVISAIGNKNHMLTFFRNSDNIICVKCSCGYSYLDGTIDEFEKKIEKKYGDSKDGQVYCKAIELAKLHIETGEV